MTEWTTASDCNFEVRLPGREDRKFNHVSEEFEGKKVMPTMKSFTAIVKDIHDTLDHMKGERKTYEYLKVEETYDNLLMTVMKQVITNYVRWAEKNEGKESLTMLYIKF